MAVDSYVQLLRRVPRRASRKTAWLKLKNELLLNKSYQWRLMYLRVCRQVLVHYSKRFFKENFLESILSIDYDRVSSVSRRHTNQSWSSLEWRAREGPWRLVRIDREVHIFRRMTVWFVTLSIDMYQSNASFSLVHVSVRFVFNSFHCWLKSNRFFDYPWISNRSARSKRWWNVSLRTKRSLSMIWPTMGSCNWIRYVLIIRRRYFPTNRTMITMINAKKAKSSFSMNSTFHRVDPRVNRPISIFYRREWQTRPFLWNHWRPKVLERRRASPTTINESLHSPRIRITNCDRLELHQVNHDVGRRSSMVHHRHHV